VSDATKKQKENNNGKWTQKTEERERKLYLQGPHLYTLCKLLACSSPLHTPENPPFFRLLKLWKLKAFKL
jgi:hypothetical protein